MKVLVTAGSTNVPIDQVRAITNIFKGRTGTEIAECFAKHGIPTKLLTSSPHLVNPDVDMEVDRFKNFDELHDKMEAELLTGQYDILIHSAAVSDYKCEGVYFREDCGCLLPLDNSEKVSSQHKELYLKMVPTCKLIDKVRTDWKFNGLVVKFKLEVGLSDKELIDVATKSMVQSDADMIIANCLEWSAKKAFVIEGSTTTKVTRQNLAQTLFKKLLGDHGPWPKESKIWRDFSVVKMLN